jgi:hypothetical protein
MSVAASNTEGFVIDQLFVLGRLPSALTRHDEATACGTIRAHESVPYRRILASALSGNVASYLALDSALGKRRSPWWPVINVTPSDRSPADV